MKRTDWDLVINKYKENYVKMLEILYPSKGSSGFTERNLSVNFAKAYEEIHPNAITWYEFQFGENNNLHYDAIIINPDQKELVIVEAKRFSNLNKKIREIGNDISRIVDYNQVEFLGRLSDFNKYSIVGVILADVWANASKSKHKIKESFDNKGFLYDYRDIIGNDYSVQLSNIKYYTIDFECLKRKDIDVVKYNYYLESIIWRLN